MYRWHYNRQEAFYKQYVENNLDIVEYKKAYFYDTCSSTFCYDDRKVWERNLKNYDGGDCSRDMDIMDFRDAHYPNINEGDDVMGWSADLWYTEFGDLKEYNKNG